MSFLIKKLIYFKIFWKRLILVSLDILTILFCFYLSHVFTSKNSEYNLEISLLIINIICAILVYFFTKKYNSILRFFQSNIIYIHCVRNFLFTLIAFLVSFLKNGDIPNINLLILFWLLLSLFNIFTSKLISDFLLKETNIVNSSKVFNVVIYGAGKFGVELLSSFKSNKKYKVKYFIDDDKSIWYRNISGVYIYPIQRLEKDFEQIDQILIAIPNLESKKRKEIYSLAKGYKIKTLQIPSIDEITSKGLKINSLKPIEIEDLLYRDPIPPKKELLYEATNNNIILITGAGGSIGSELSRQVSIYNPKGIVFLDRCEYNLYCLEKEINEIFPNKNIFSFVLGDILDSKFINKLVDDMNVNIIFHAAAYKHVPLIEKNPLKGIENNIIGTLNLCNTTLNNSVDKFILISTDKAVRPSNVMGASKRVSELIVMSYGDKERQKKISNPNYKLKIFTMVRFGNVLASSGSVVPLFKEQIKNREPITITHPDIVRYFMTISEAASLVIQASAMAKGSDLFLFDMGELISIKTLAEKMISISGLTQKTKKNPKGDIEIIYTGLRPGEKLFEELLIDSDASKTIHPRIFTARDSFITTDEIMPKLDKLKAAIEDQNTNQAIKILKNLVKEWKPQNDTFS